MHRAYNGELEDKATHLCGCPNDILEGDDPERRSRGGRRK